MARRKNAGDGRNKKTVDARQEVISDTASAHVHQPIPGPRSLNSLRSGGAVQLMRNAAVGDGVRQQQADGGPGTAAQRRRRQKPKAAARADVKTAKAKSAATVPVDHNKPANRRFVCNLCQKTFFYKHVLQNHIRTHTGEKPYMCMVCQKKFTRAHHLTTHNRLHTGEKPYLCMCCNRFFLQVSNLRRHLKTHVGCTSMNLCVHCGKVFATADDLAVHRVNVKKCNRRCQSPGNNTAAAAAATITSAAAAATITSAAAAATITSAAVDSTSAASASAAAAATAAAATASAAEASAAEASASAVAAASAYAAAVAYAAAAVAATAAATATGFAVPSAPAFVANPPPVYPWPSADHGSSLPWTLNAAGYPLPSVHPYWSSLSSMTVYDAPAVATFLYDLPTDVYGSPVVSFLHGFVENQLLVSTAVSPAPPTAAVYCPLDNGYWTTNPCHQHRQTAYAAEQTEPVDLSVRADDSGKLGDV